MRDDPWDRASLDMNVRPRKVVRNVTRNDLFRPQGPGTPRMLALTLGGGICMAMLYVWPPLMIVAILTSVGLESWFWIIVGAAAVVFWVGLFTFAVRESAADRRYAEQLHLPG